MERSLVRSYSIKRLSNGASERILDTVAAEEPLEIRIQYWFKDARLSRSLALAMRTPGHDRELAVGFLVSEGVVRKQSDLTGVRALGPDPSDEIVAELAHEVDFESWRVERTSFVGASCGVCGKRSRDVLAANVPPRVPDDFRVAPSLIEQMPGLLRGRQAGFAQTGGLHAAALFDSAGRLDAVFEDIGRHNALDKVIGSAFLKGRLPLRESVLFLSSRGSFELVQKAIMAGAPVLATVGGPSSLAIEAARDYGLTLLGFVREKRFNIYAGEWRINS
ncbi:MAG: formate dehydrogenase accessory sulfurtransferase FdhD [Acidobacteriaceae bacterium]|nr:formate dehydrogenase accessory sulfurtransferase FdhD [Acidobacteriaceae bacterium]